MLFRSPWRRKISALRRIVLLSSITRTRTDGNAGVAPAATGACGASAMEGLVLCMRHRGAFHQMRTISKSSLRAPHSGHVQFIGTAAQAVPGSKPVSASPTASSYIQPQIRHIQVWGSFTGVRVQGHYNRLDCSHGPER